jgi:hypothetical protein
MSSILETLRKNKPELNEKSIKAYNSTLKNIYEKVYPNTEISVKRFNNTKAFLKYLEDVEFNKRKSILSALLAITGKEQYRESMLADIETYNDQVRTNEKTDREKENWVTADEIQNKYDEYKQYFDVFSKYNGKKELPMSKIQLAQDFIILCLCAGLFIAPRRSLDYTLCKVNNYDETEDNVYADGVFVFNKYKTAHKYGTMMLEVPTELESILTIWINNCPETDLLLFDRKMQELTPVKLNQRLNKIFNGKKVGVSMLRHIYITEKYDSGVDVAEMRDMAEDMGHSVDQAINYYKKK